MKQAETVTFGGSNLDRAAELRSDIATTKALPGASTILMWRGKPMLDGSKLVRVPLDHAILADADAVMVIGRDETGPILAHDLSGWTPDDLDASQLGGFVDTSRQTHPAMPDNFQFAELRMVMTKLSSRDAEIAATARGIFEWHRTHGFCARCGERSEMAVGGWERQCPSCGRKHFPRTDPVVIMLITHSNSVLLGRSHGWPEGMYSCLAGFVEPGETIEAAVRRETFEEAGVRVGQVDYLASQPWPFPASLMMGCRGQALSREITVDPEEIDDAIWVTREEVALAFAGEHPRIKAARPGAIAHFLLRHWLADTLD
ncbi:MAG: NAD(+) diphosphatase [Marinovum sp.]|nr:NAD(+) diphosphatase [Marinovum sp.]